MRLHGAVTGKRNSSKRNDWRERWFGKETDCDLKHYSEKILLKMQLRIISATSGDLSLSFYLAACFIGRPSCILVLAEIATWQLPH